MKFETMKHAISIARRSTGKNELNEPTGTLEPIGCGPILASVRPLAGKEYLAASQVQASVTHEVRLRWIPDVRPSDVVIFGDRQFDIKAALNIDEANVELVLMCTEHLAA